MALILGAASVAAGLMFAGKVRLPPSPSSGTDRVFYVVAYHYGFAFYDSRLVERDRIEVKAGERVTLFVVPAQSLPRDVFLTYAERTLRQPVGGLAPGDPAIRKKILDDLGLGNVEHIVGIAGHPVYVTTNVAAALGGLLFREAGPGTLAEAVRRQDPTIKSVSFTAKKVGAFDVICIDSGMDGAGTCGWGHKWMVARGAFVVRP